MDLIDEIDVALVGHRQGLEAGLAGGLRAHRFSLVEEVVFGSEGAEAVAESKGETHLIGIIIIVRSA